MPEQAENLNAVLHRGDIALDTLKRNAKLTRYCYRDMGMALLELRKLHPADRDYSDAVHARGYDWLLPRERSESIRLASQWEDVEIFLKRTGRNLNHPRVIFAELKNWNPEASDSSANVVEIRSVGHNDRPGKSDDAIDAKDITPEPVKPEPVTPVTSIKKKKNETYTDFFRRHYPEENIEPIIKKWNTTPRKYKEILSLPEHVALAIRDNIVEGVKFKWPRTGYDPRVIRPDIDKNVCARMMEAPAVNGHVHPAHDIDLINKIADCPGLHTHKQLILDEHIKAMNGELMPNKIPVSIKKPEWFDSKIAPAGWKTETFGTDKDSVPIRKFISAIIEYHEDHSRNQGHHAYGMCINRMNTNLTAIHKAGNMPRLFEALSYWSIYENNT